MNIVGLIKSLVSINQNRRFDRVKSPEESFAFSGETWAKKNAEVGGKTARYLELSFGLGIIKNYFNSFFNLEENPILGFVVRAITGVGDFLEGKRDEEMFSIYGHGVDELSGKDSSELTNEDNALNKFGFVDDYLMNKRQEALYGETFVSKFAEWSAWAAKIKPIAHFVSGVLGNNWKAGVQTLLDLPARIYWRIRFFGKSLHGNFVTSIWELAKFKFLSSLLRSSDAAKNYANKVKELGNLSNEYFKGKNSEYKNVENPGLSTYVNMLTDRMTEHWQNIWDPKAALERKCNDKFLQRTTEQERATDPSKTFENGYIDPNAKYDRKEQSRLAVVDFTGPICAALGLVGTVIFDPLKIIWGFAGFEKGKSLINALSASRKSFSLINYIFRFIIPEMNEGAKYKDLEKHMNSESRPNKAISELYYASKSRYCNALIGMAMAAGNIFEPLLHLKRGIVGDSKIGNFLMDSFMRFNDTFFLLFSKRREVQGRLEQVRVMAQEVAKRDGRKFVTQKDYEKITNDEFDKAMKGRTTLPADNQEPSMIEGFLDKVVNIVRSVEAACSGEASFS